MHHPLVRGDASFSCSAWGVARSPGAVPGEWLRERYIRWLDLRINLTESHDSLVLLVPFGRGPKKATFMYQYQQKRYLPLGYDMSILQSLQVVRSEQHNQNERMGNAARSYH